MMNKEERLQIISKILESIGEVRTDDIRKNSYESSDDVFYELTNALKWDQFEEANRFDMKYVLDPPEKLKERLRWKRDNEGNADNSMITTLADMITIKAGKIINIDKIAQGIINILDLMDEHNDLRLMYQDYFEEHTHKELAMEKLKTRLEDINYLGSKKSLIFLREYELKSAAGMPLEKLPLPAREVQVKKIMKRSGLVSDENNSKDIIKKGEKYFKVPLIADYGLWFIGNKFCKKKNPDCENCILYKHADEDLCYRNI